MAAIHLPSPSRSVEEEELPYFQNPRALWLLPMGRKASDFYQPRRGYSVARHVKISGAVRRLKFAPISPNLPDKTCLIPARSLEECDTLDFYGVFSTAHCCAITHGPKVTLLSVT